MVLVQTHTTKLLMLKKDKPFNFRFKNKLFRQQNSKNKEYQSQFNWES